MPDTSERTVLKLESELDMDSKRPPVRYATLIADWLLELGYTHCFFVAGGGCMHLIDGFRTRFQCIPVVHEVTAGIAAEHFNECSSGNRAFALVTTGPGLTNLVTAIAACYAEHRQLLVIAGQVKSTDIAPPMVRQLGVQEVDGVALCNPISVAALRLQTPSPRSVVTGAIELAHGPHPGPVVIEVCLDTQGAMVDAELLNDVPGVSTANAEAVATGSIRKSIPSQGSGIDALLKSLDQSCRPVLLIGGLVTRSTAWSLQGFFENLKLPVLTTTSAIDRLPTDLAVNCGRVGTWGGQRAANMILAQADVVIACGAQLDLQQTGFDVDNFAPLAKLFQIFPSSSEITKPKPKLEAGINADPDTMLRMLSHQLASKDASEWLDYATHIRRLVPTLEPANHARDGYVLSFQFLQRLSDAAQPADAFALSSSGGSFTGALQMYRLKPGQYASVSAAFASMGYGLGTAIGMSFALPGRRIIATEGDGGFSQNLQELAMVRRHNLPIKIFVLHNDGYASIRATQRKFFNGAYVGCDPSTGLGFPDWIQLFNAYSIPCRWIKPEDTSIENLSNLLNRTEGPEAFVVPIDPEQTNWPAVASRMLPDGCMVSAPIYDMLPELAPEVKAAVARHLQ